MKIGTDDIIIQNPDDPDDPIVEDNSLSFDGVNDYVGLGVSLLNNMTHFTMAGWLNINSSGNREGFFGQNNAIEFGWQNSSSMWGWSASGGQVFWSIDNSFSFGQWHHIVLVGDGTSMKIYIDGQLKATGGGSTSNYGSSSYPFNIGGGGIWDVTGSSVSYTHLTLPTTPYV